MPSPEPVIPAGINAFDRKQYTKLFRERQSQLNRQIIKGDISVPLSIALMSTTAVLAILAGLLHPLLVGLLIAPWVLIVCLFSFRAGTMLGADYGFYVGTLAQLPKDILASKDIMIAIEKSLQEAEHGRTSSL